MGTDILILTIYLICVIYVLYQMALSVEAKLEDQVAIVLDHEALQASVTSQLQQQTVYQVKADVSADNPGQFLDLTFLHEDDVIGKVILQVSPQGKRPIKPDLSTLSVTVVNSFPDQQVFVNWDSSSLSMHGGLAHRVIRMVPGRPIDLFQRQVMTVANPGQVVNATVTSEALFNRPEDKTVLESGQTLIDFEKVLEMKEPMRHYSLGLLVWVRSMVYPNSPALQLLIPFNFRIDVLPDHVALPILSWLLDFFSPQKKQKA